MGSSVPSSFRILPLPKPHPDTQTQSIYPNYTLQLQHKYRALRLLALKTSPTSFASIHAHEAAFPAAVWAQRLANPHAVQFVAVASHEGDADADAHTYADADGGGVTTSTPTEERTVERLVKEEWLGMIVLVGPLTPGKEVSAARSPWKPVAGGGDGAASAAPPAPAPAPGAVSVTPAAGDSNNNNNTALRPPSPHYQLSGTFVVRAARQLGLGRRLVEAAVAHARSASRADGAGKVRVTVMVEAENAAAVALYAGRGFVKVREEVMMAREKVVDGTEVPPREEVIWVMEWWGDR